VTGTNPIGVTGNAATGGAGTSGTRNNGTGANTGVRSNINQNAVPNQRGARVNQNSGFDFSGNGISQTPFFNDRGVRRQLNLNDSQFNSLNSAYQNAYNNYTRSVRNLNSNLTPLQRAAQMQQLENQFNNSFGSSLDSTFINPQYRTRYDQLNRQYMGFNAFNNPAIQSQLNLTPQQQMQIRQLSADWRRQQLANGGTGTQQSQMYSQYWDQLNSVLTPQQQQTWAQLTGERYAFPTNAATPNAGSSGTVGTPGGAANGTAPPNGASPTGVGTMPPQQSIATPPSGSTRAPQSSAAQSGLQPATNTNSSSGAAAEGTAK
jgi:hypothetical protein